MEITLYFGQVQASFMEVENPRIYVDVLSESQALLPDGMMFASKVDVGGRVVGTDEYVIGNLCTIKLRGVVMTRHSLNWSESVYRRYIREGRGQGVGLGYKPWFAVRDFPF